MANKSCTEAALSSARGATKELKDKLFAGRLVMRHHLTLPLLLVVSMHLFSLTAGWQWDESGDRAAFHKLYDTLKSDSSSPDVVREVLGGELAGRDEAEIRGALNTAFSAYLKQTSTSTDMLVAFLEDERVNRGFLAEATSCAASQRMYKKYYDRITPECAARALERLISVIGEREEFVLAELRRTREVRVGSGVAGVAGLQHGVYSLLEGLLKKIGRGGVSAYLGRTQLERLPLLYLQVLLPHPSIIYDESDLRILSEKFTPSILSLILSNRTLSPRPRSRHLRPVHFRAD